MITKRAKDTIWNSMGSGAFAAISFILLIIVTRQYGVEASASIGIYLTTSQLLFRVGVFAVRQYQVTDSKEEYSFSDYAVAKIISTTICIIGFLVFILLNKSFGKGIWALLLIFLFYQLLSIDDLYQNRFFQKGRLYDSGKSKFYVISSYIFTFIILSIFEIEIEIVLLCSLAISIFVSIVFCFLREKIIIGESSVKKGYSIIALCIPAFVSNILLTLINSMPKYAVFYLCSKEESGHINDVIVFLSIVELLGSFIYYPFIADISDNMRANRKAAKSLVKSIGLKILAVAMVVTVCSYFWGAEVLSIVYGIDFSGYRFEIVYIVGICGGAVSAISLLYWIPVILRDQKILVIVFICGAVIASAGSFAGVASFGVRGGIIGYSIGIWTICILLILFFYKKVRHFQ